MNLLVISDIHGSRSGAACIAEAKAYHQADQILCLGDFLYHGPRNDLPADYAPKEVIALLNPLAAEITAVRGNCDAEVDQMVLHFPLTADYSVLYLGGRKVFATHGHHSSPQNLPPLQPGDIFLSGHTHIPTAELKDGIYLLNPGSVALPKGGHPKTYAVLNEQAFTVYTLDHQTYMTIHLT